ncbi:MAG: extracellular solute-binding protein [Lachnospiraceae bacterium]|nr:extracellular solute-binding protein [Lachnospiraceae bacterium]
MKKSNLFTKMMHVCLILTMLISMVGCGSTAETQNTASEYVYVPTFMEIDVEEADWLSDAIVVGDELYTSYSIYDEVTYESEQKFVKKNLTDGSGFTELPIQIVPTVENYQTSVNSFCMDENANIYVLAYEYPKYDPENPESSYEEVKPVYSVFKYDKDGNQIFANDISVLLQKDEMNSYVQRMLVDKNGRIFLSSNNLVFVLDENGNELCTIDTQAEWINSLGMDKAGKVYASMYGMDYNGLELVELNADTKAIGNKISGCPDTNGNGSYYPGIEAGMLIGGSECLYEFNPATGEVKEVVDWLSCNINGSYVQSVKAGEDGKLYVFICEYSSEENRYELVILEKKPASEVTAKEEIVVGTLYSNQALQSAAVKFNKANSQYQVTLKVYIPDTVEWTETTYEDALKLFNADLTSSNCPDIIDLSLFNTDNLVAKGLIEDLTPYLEKSTTLSKDDFLDNVIATSTVDGVLATIPTYVNLQGIIGRASQLGDVEGWTIDEFISFTEQYPDAKVFNYATKASMLSIFLNYSIRDFVDYSTGKCNFDSEQFIKVLEFCNRFDLEYVYNENESFPDMVQSGQILLADTGFYSMTEYQMYSLMFPEEIKVMGYPTTDGEGGIKLSSYNTFAMTTKSENKEGAWAFLESTLQYEEYDEWGHNGFPVRKDMLEEMFAKASTPDYIYDENGEIMLDEQGNKMENPKTIWGYDNWNADIYAATKEQCDAVRELLEKGEMTSNMDQGLYDIISEDVEGYFQGQKSAQDVAKIIQSRAQIYVDENM